MLKWKQVYGAGKDLNFFLKLRSNFEEAVDTEVTAREEIFFRMK